MLKWLFEQSVSQSLKAIDTAGRSTFGQSEAETAAERTVGQREHHGLSVLLTAVWV
jgi:hypothetical protein